MKVLVTGGNGFVGKHVVHALRQDDHDVLVPGRQQLDLIMKRGPGYHTDMMNHSDEVSFINWYLQENRVEAIVHLAAICGGIGVNQDNPGKFMYENLQMGLNLFEAARVAKVSKIVNLATVCAYPKFTPVPFRETDIWNGYPEETNAPYGIAKKTIMELGIAYHKQYGMNITNLVPVNMAGEYDHFDLYSSHVLPALIRKFEEADDSVMLWGTGAASREFLYAGDCAKAIAVAVNKDTGPLPINLGTGDEITIRTLAETVKSVGGYHANIYWDHTKPDGQPRRCLDTSRAKHILRWEATTPINDIIFKTIQWYRANK